MTFTSTGSDRLKVEALAHGASDRDLDKAQAAIGIAFEEFGWAKAAVRYLFPWFNGGCPWGAELLRALRAGLAGINAWAWDHLSLESWLLPLPRERPGVRLVGRQKAG